MFGCTTYRVGQKSYTSRSYITLCERYHFFGPPCRLPLTLSYSRNYELSLMGVGSGLYMYDVVVKRSRSLSHLLMSFCIILSNTSIT